MFIVFDYIFLIFRKDVDSEKELLLGSGNVRL